MNQGRKTPAKDPMKPAHRALVDFGPLLVFFAVNYGFGIFYATASLMVTMPIAIFISWRVRKALSPMLWISGLLVLVFGGLTLYLQDERFIKIKPTIIFSLFGLVLLGGLIKGKPLIKYLLDSAFPPIAHRGWMMLSRNWMLYFLAMAGANEFVWRTFSTDTWVAVKTFGYVTASFLFMMAQVPLLMKYAEKRKSPKR